MTEIVSLVFSRDGHFVKLANEAWAPSILISTELIRSADPRYLRVGEGVLEFALDNGHAIYEVTGMSDLLWSARLLEGEVSGTG